jgi:hypothetical protein
MQQRFRVPGTVATAEKEPAKEDVAERSERPRKKMKKVERPLANPKEWPARNPQAAFVIITGGRSCADQGRAGV